MAKGTLLWKESGNGAKKDGIRRRIQRLEQILDDALPAARRAFEDLEDFSDKDENIYDALAELEDLISSLRNANQDLAGVVGALNKAGK